MIVFVGVLFSRYVRRGLPMEPCKQEHFEAGAAAQGSFGSDTRRRLEQDIFYTRRRTLSLISAADPRGLILVIEIKSVITALRLVTHDRPPPEELIVRNTI
jgi:hypothetical protein